jgi:hypothetical protein
LHILIGDAVKDNRTMTLSQSNRPKNVNSKKAEILYSQGFPDCLPATARTPHHH